MKIEEIPKGGRINLRISQTKIGKSLFTVDAISQKTPLGFYTGTVHELSPKLSGNDKLLRLREKPPWYPKDKDFPNSTLLMDETIRIIF